MKSFKPGRAPSLISGIIGIFMVCFGIAWCVFAFSVFPPLVIIGVLWTAVAVAITVYNFRNAISKNRNSIIDAVDSKDAPDPLNSLFEDREEKRREAVDNQNKYCPFCGMPVREDFEFCNSCGKRLP